MQNDEAGIDELCPRPVFAAAIIFPFLVAHTPVRTLMADEPAFGTSPHQISSVASTGGQEPKGCVTLCLSGSLAILHPRPCKTFGIYELGMIRPYWCPGNYNVADFFSKLLEKGLFTMHAHRFGMNFEETVVGKLAEVYQTVHLKEFTDFPKKDEKDPTTVFTDIHFEKKSVAYEAYHLSHGLCQ